MKFTRNRKRRWAGFFLLCQRNDLLPPLISLAILFFAGSVTAQEQSRTELLQQKRLEKSKNLKPYQPGKLERLLLFVETFPFEEIFEDGYKGFTPMIGGLKNGAGAGGGIRFQPTDDLDRLYFSAKAAFSIHAYQDYQAIFGIELGKMNIFTYAQHRVSPQENFYGIGQKSLTENRTSFELDDTYFGGLISLRPGSWFGAYLQGSFAKFGTEKGKREEFPSIEKIFTPTAAPGLGYELEYFIATAKLEFDTRKIETNKYSALNQALLDDPLRERGVNPSKGTYFALKASQFKDRDSGLFDFNRIDMEFQQLFSMYYGSRVLAFRNFISIIDKKEEAFVPFYLMQPLGGSMSLRGYEEFRFRDLNTLLFNVEYRWMAWAGLDIALFYDAGKSFSDRDEFSFENLKSDYGIGFRFNSDSSVWLRFDIARGDEGMNYILKFDNIF